ncbi:MAG: rod shape-determining protein MreC [Alphaproteobacteria bacterium]|nr:rod shape-determining protein MreC [Alphaproteobacteria bacterium]
MSQTKKSSKIYPLVKAAAAAAVLPVLFIYIMIAKPDYRLMNAMGHVVVPVAQWVGNIVTWPIRAVGGAIDNIAEISSLRTENEELRARLDEALANKYECNVVIKENQKLAQELDLIKSKPQDIIIADIIHDNSALGHKTFIINRGIKNGIEQGMVVTSTDMTLVGIVIDVATDFSRVRALTDSDTNIAVRVVGSEVYGFLSGNGSSTPKMKFFSDPEFQPSAGIKLVTSNISGILPAGLIVGEMIDETDVKITPVSKISRVMVLKFDAQQNKYK